MFTNSFTARHLFFVSSQRQLLPRIPLAASWDIMPLSK